jgi:putative RNA 2'-phosphotransferase
MSEQLSTERLTRSLAYMLRHQPDEFDIEVDKFGFADLEDVLDELSDRFDEDIEVEDITKAIEEGDRPRYEIVDGKIRALYGHSIEVDPGESTEPPEKLYLGMGSRDADRASRNGLNAGRRRFLHLATSEEDAKEMGRRAAPEYTVVTIFARDAWEDGVSFYDRKALFLSDAIPTDHLEVGDVYTDGEQRDRGGRGGRGGDRGGRGGDRGGRGGDRGGRGGDRGGRGGRSDERKGSSDQRGARSDERKESSDQRVASSDQRGGRGDARGGRDDRREEPRKEKENTRGENRESGNGGGRDTGDRRPARRDESPQREAQKQESPSAKAPVGGFGGGLSSRSAQAPTRAEKPEQKPERKAEKKPEKKPEPVKAEVKADPGPSFGGGL